MAALIVCCSFVLGGLAAAVAVGWLTWMVVESEFRTLRSIALLLILYTTLIL